MGRTVIHVVQIPQRVIRVVKHEGSPQAVAVLSSDMRVIPEGPRLARGAEVVKERVVCSDGALVDECRTVCPVRVLLEETVPVLRREMRERSSRVFE